MSVLGSLRVGVVGLFVAASLVLAGPASADEFDDVGSFESPSQAGDDFMAPFIAFFVVTVLISIGIAIWKVSTARDLARQAGMDPDVATGMTLLDDNGLSATYLASSLRTAGPTTPAATPGPPSAIDRLAELKGLLDGGLITQNEYDQRRQAIIDSV